MRSRYLFNLCLLLILCLLLPACESSPTKGIVSPDLPFSSFSYPDPFTEADYDNYSLGTDMGIMDWTTMEEDFEGNNTIYQVLYEYSVLDSNAARDAGEKYVLPILGMFRYDHFPYSTGKEGWRDPVWFRGNQRLYAVIDMYEDNPFYQEEYLVPVASPEAYGLMEDLVFSLPYKEGHHTWYSFDIQAWFVVEDRRTGDRTEYILNQDGTVIQNGPEGEYYSTRKLNRQEMAALFALKYAYVFAYNGSISYEVERDYEQLNQYFSIQVEMGEQTWTLSTEDSYDFLPLVSTEPWDERTEQQFCWPGTMRTNWGTDDHGEEVLRYTITRYQKNYINDTEIGYVVYTERTYILHEDGHISRNYGTPSELMHVDATVYQLLVRRFYVSDVAFDVQAILDYLATLPAD